MLIHRRLDLADAEAAQRVILADERLSLVAVAVLLKLLSHAPEWNINAQTFYEIGAEVRGGRADSKRSIRMAFHELEALGYMRRTTERQSSGGFFTLLEAADVPHEFDVATQGRLHGVMPPEGAGLVYIFGPADSSVVKIGTTTNVVSRLSGVQTGHPLLLLAKWTCRGNAELESYLHRKFHAIRMQGEWFNFGDAEPIAEVRAAAEVFYQLSPGALADTAGAQVAAG